MMCVLCVSMYFFTCKYACMYLCPYFVVCLKQCIVGVSETFRLILKVYLLHTLPLAPLSLGDKVFLQNQRGSHPKSINYIWREEGREGWIVG